MNATEVFIGIDVSKDTLDVAVRPTAEEMTFANTEDGIALMTDFIQPFSARLIVLEATGGWEMTAASALAAKGLPVVIVNPRHVRDFAGSATPQRRGVPAVGSFSGQASPTLADVNRRKEPSLSRSPMDEEEYPSPYSMVGQGAGESKPRAAKSNPEEPSLAGEG